MCRSRIRWIYENVISAIMNMREILTLCFDKAILQDAVTQMPRFRVKQ